MPKQPKHKVVSMYDSIRDNFRNGYDGLTIHQAVGILFIMDMLEDIALTYKLNSKQRFAIAKEILHLYNMANLEGPGGTLSFVIDCVIALIMDDEELALSKFKAADVTDYILDMFKPDSVVAIIEFIEDESYFYDMPEDDETKGATDA